MRKEMEKRLRIAVFAMLFCAAFSQDVPGASIVDYDPTYSTSGDHWLSTDFGSSVTHGTDSAAYGYGANALGNNASAFGSDCRDGANIYARLDEQCGGYRKQ